MKIFVSVTGVEDSDRALCVPLFQVVCLNLVYLNHCSPGHSGLYHVLDESCQLVFYVDPRELIAIKFTR